MDYEKGKINLVKMFRKTLKDADISRLNREKELFSPSNLEKNLRKRIISINDYLDTDGKIGTIFQKQLGYSINLTEPNETEITKIHISPVKVKFCLNWSSWKRTTGYWPFNAKRKKLEEMQNYMKSNNLFNATLIWGYGYDEKWRDRVQVELEIYAIFYGNFVRELSIQEYKTLVAEYNDRICNIDANEIERIVKI